MEITRAFDGSNNKFFFRINGTTKGTLISNWTGGYVQAGIEAYAAGASMAKTDFFSLQYQKNNGALLSWAGRDASLVNAGFCGSWQADTTWRAGKGNGC